MTQRFIVILWFLVPLAGQVFAAEADPAAEQAVPEEKKFYKRIGPDGQVIYTDKPQKGSEEIKMREPTTYKPVTPALRPSSRDVEDSPRKSEKSQPFRYESLVINSPAREETIWNNEGALGVSVSVEPSLRISHQLSFYVDGVKRQTDKVTSVNLSGIDPGEHTLKVEVLDASGSVQISESVVFFMRRHVIKR